MAKTLFQIDIPRRNNQCSLAQEPLLPGMEYFSLLADDEQQNIIRHDYCASCWHSMASKNIQGDQTYWKAKVLAKLDLAKLPKDRNERALILLKEALAGQTEQHEEEAFVLALFLARQRWIALRQAQEKDGVVIQLYENLETEEMIPVKKLKLAQLRVQEIQRILAEKMKV